MSVIPGYNSQFELKFNLRFTLCLFCLLTITVGDQVKMACRSHSAKQGHRAMPNQSGRLMKQSLLTRHIQTSCGHCAAITYETNLSLAI